MKIAVVGGGIAGCSAAYALSRRGAEVVLIDEALAGGGSGNRVGIFHPRIEKQWSPITRFYLSAFGHARQQLAELDGKGEWWDSPGMLQFPKWRDPAKSETRLQDLPSGLGLPLEVARFVEAQEANGLARVSSEFGALHFPQGTWVSPREWCGQLAKNSSYRVGRVKSLVRAGEWRVSLRDEVVEADRVIVASANQVSFYPALSSLPLRAVRGQITEVPVTAESKNMQRILCYDGYVSPPLGGVHWCGSTYDYENRDLAPNAEGNEYNLSMAARIWPQLFAGVKADGLRARAAFRAVTPDRVPLIGQWEDGLYLSLGHGSRGLLSAPLGGELLASMILGEPLPCEADVIRMLNPKRFAIR